ILDPACGTGTFLYTVVDHIREQFMDAGNAGLWNGYVRKHLLPRLFGFELLMAPYAVAHFKLGMQLGGHDLSEAQRKNWAYDFTGNERLGIYLTNTLEEAEKKIETLYVWSAARPLRRSRSRRSNQTRHAHNGCHGEFAIFRPFSQQRHCDPTILFPNCYSH
ncbi:hypothetical protein LCGC14_2986660, partial [marine sediment metagenome]